jgi:hypothetical protein
MFHRSRVKLNHDPGHISWHLSQAPFQGSSATTTPYVSHSNGVQHAMMAPQVRFSKGDE